MLINPLEIKNDLDFLKSHIQEKLLLPYCEETISDIENQTEQEYDYWGSWINSYDEDERNEAIDKQDKLCKIKALCVKAKKLLNEPTEVVVTIKDDKEIVEHFEKVVEDIIGIRESVLVAIASKQSSKATEMIVEYILDNNYIYTTRDDKKSEVWIYNEGIYIPQGQTYIKEISRKVLSHFYTTYLCNNVISKIEADTYISQEEFFEQKNVEEIPVMNGILNIKTKKLSSFNENKIFFNKLPIFYNERATCNVIDQHFKSVVKEEDVTVLYEIFGYLLLKESRFEKSFMFTGGGRNGKSKILELMKKFVGSRNCSALPLTSMNSESFSLSEMSDKLANLGGDLSYTALQDTGMFKQLVGRDEIQAKRKFLNDLFFENYSKLIFSCNILPKIYDTSDGFWTKWILLEFPYKFVRRDEYEAMNDDEKKNKKIMDENVIKKITTATELSGLLNVALKSLQTIIKNNGFSYSQGTEDIKNTWVRQSDSFLSFAIENVKQDYVGKVSKQELRVRYNEYCRKHSVRTSGEKSIRNTLETNYGASTMQINSTGERLWQGISFVEEIIEESIKDFILQKCKSGCCNLNEIIEKFKELSDINEAIENLKRDGLIFEELEGIYKLLQ